MTTRLRRLLAVAAFGLAALPLRAAVPAIEEIVVTARKVSEPIERVPLAVQALPGDDLARRNLTSLYDWQFEAPGLVVIDRGMFGAGIALRGVGDEGGGSLAVAPSVNGVYLGRSNLALTRQFDVERIEVLKGPQGTLWGRNSTGGTINVVTRVPAGSRGVGLEAAIGSFDTTRVAGHADWSRGGLSTRVSFAGSGGGGYIRNSVDDRRFAEQDFAAVRAAVHAQPTAALAIDAMVQRVQDDGAAGELWLPRRDFLPNPADIRLTTVTLANPYLHAADDLATLDVAYDLGELTLRSVTGYARSDTSALDDCAGTPQLAGCVRSVSPLLYEQRSQELRIESASDGATFWRAGAFYFSSDEFQRFTFRVPRVGVAPINDSSSRSGETASALFGEASRRIRERWHVTAGLRYNHERQSVFRQGIGSADPPTPRANVASWSDNSWRVGFDFAASSRWFLYTTLSKGVKSPGVTTDLLPDGTFNRYDPEQLLALELGAKATLANGRSLLQASLFDYDFEDMQVSTIAVFANRVTSVIDNAAAARLRGVDVSTTTRLSERLTFTGGLVWLPTREFTEFVTAGVSLTGNTPSRAPEWSATASLGYRVPLARGALEASADMSYRSEFFFTKENEPLLSQDAFGLLGFTLRYEPSAVPWYAFAIGRNVLDTDYFNQILIQSSPGYPARYELGFGWRF